MAWIDYAYGESPPPPAFVERPLCLIVEGLEATNVKHKKNILFLNVFCKPEVWGDSLSESWAKVVDCAFPQCAREQLGERWQICVPIGLSWGPFWSHFGVLWGVFGGLEAQMAGERRLREVLGRSGSPLRVVGEPSWAVQGALWGHLGPSWSRQGPSWGRLGAILGRLGAILGRLGAPLGLWEGLREPPWGRQCES